MVSTVSPSASVRLPFTRSRTYAMGMPAERLAIDLIRFFAEVLD
jgi:hypothetical protein